MFKRFIVIAGLALSMAIALAAVAFADSVHGDCKNDNAGNHNGYECSVAPGDDKPGNGPQDKPADEHGDCKNDNAGRHNGYDCPADGGGGGNGGDGGDGGDGGGNGGGNGGGGTTVAATGSAPVTTTVIDFAPAAAPGQAVLGEKLRACTSRRSFTIHIRRYRGVRYRSVRVSFNGKVLASRKGNRRVAAPIALKGLPRGTFTIRIRAVTTKGRVLTGKRVYHTCVGKAAPHRAPRL